MAMHLCDPHSPRQCGSNENTYGLARQYLQKGTAVPICSQEQFDAIDMQLPCKCHAIADEINGRPKKGFGVLSALAVCR